MPNITKKPVGEAQHSSVQERVCEKKGIGNHRHVQFILNGIRM